MEQDGSTVERSLSRIAARDGAVRAWVHVDADAAGEPIPGSELRGLTLGVKDIIDVGGMPCEHGSPIHRGRVPAHDAALVASLRALGATIVGKTETTELAFLSPAATRNPRNLAHSPGGSSSGSAAAVADRHVDAALGTQTAGSLLRPASFCGVVGFKPTHGRFSIAGVKSCAPSLDTIGWIAADVATAARIYDALEGAQSAVQGTVGFARTHYWAQTEPAMRAAFERLCGAMGWPEVAGPAPGLEAVQVAIMRFEMCRELAMERLQFPDLLSPQMRAFLDPAAVSGDDYRRALDARAAVDIEALFGGADVLAMPAALGEAPLFGSTGDASYARFASLLGLPAVSIPLGTGDNGLPLGLQLMARRWQEPLLLASARAIEERLAAGGA